MKLKSARLLCIASVVLMVLNNICLMLSPILNYDKGNKNYSFAIVCSSIFWVTIILTWTILLALYKKINSHNNIEGRAGIITFFSNPIAKIVDIVMIVLLVLLIVFFCVVDNVKVQVVFISLFIFAFQLHILLNSKLYKYIKDKRKEEER